MCHKPENKPENKPVNNDPCQTGGNKQTLKCFVVSPPNGAFVSPTKLTISWKTTMGATSCLYFGTKKDNLSCISRQSADMYALTDGYVLKNLDINTTYYWYFTLEAQCSYGCSSKLYSFTTVPDTNLPYVITAPVFTHMNTPPRVGGKVCYEGSSKLSERGIYFGLNSNPEVGGTKFQIGNGTDLFSDLLPGLNPNTTYYVKAYATNNSGTVYGSDVSFTAGQVSDYKSIKDIEGNIYYIINIGNQVWMAENLRTTMFNDGTLIPNVTDDITWETINTPAYCWYNNNPGFKSTYGALYNWYTIDSTSNGHKNVCPAGWHAPSDNEWDTLTTYLGGEAVAGIKLKETGDYYWSPSTIMGDNSSDFSALAGGYRIVVPAGIQNVLSSNFFYIGDYAEWWSSTSFNTEFAWGMHVNSVDGYVFADSPYKNYGSSIRCIKDAK